MHTKYLLQKKSDGTEVVFRWTPFLAERKDCQPLTEEQYIEWRDKREAKNPWPEMEDPEESDEAPEEEEVSEVIEEVETVEQPEQVAKSMLSQDDLKEMEEKKIKSFRSKAKLEEYILKKYKLGIAHGDIKFMKQQAYEFIGELHKVGKLYTTLEE